MARFACPYFVGRVKVSDTIMILYKGVAYQIMLSLSGLIFSAAICGLLATIVSFGGFLYLRSRSPRSGLQRLLTEYAVNSIPPDAASCRAFLVIIDLAPVPSGLTLKKCEQGLIFVFRGGALRCFDLADPGTALVPWERITFQGRSPWIPMLKRHLIETGDRNIVVELGDG